jgi:hypothetical protein
LYHDKLPDSFITHSTWVQDRATIRSWLLRSLLNPSGIWGSGLDTLLTALRTVMQNSAGGFPAVALERETSSRGKELTFSEPELEFLLDVSYRDYRTDVSYRDYRTFLLLSLLYPFVDLKNHFYVDHVFPKTILLPCTFDPNIGLVHSPAVIYRALARSKRLIQPRNILEYPAIEWRGPSRRRAPPSFLK